MYVFVCESQTDRDRLTQRGERREKGQRQTEMHRGVRNEGRRERQTERDSDWERHTERQTETERDQN